MARNRYYQGPPSDNFDGERFFNTGETFVRKGLGDVLKWKLTSKQARWPDTVPVDPVVPDTRVSGLRVTMVGHATLLIQVANLNILTDPLWSERSSPVSFAGPRRVTRPGIAFDDLPPIDAVLLSHNHYDHLDIDTLRKLHDRDAPLIVTPLGNDAILAEAIAGIRIVTGNWGDSVDLGQGAVAHIVSALHWSARGVSDACHALWGGFFLHTPAGSVYFAGDTGYGTGEIFRTIRARYGVPDVALIPIGSYAPIWFMHEQHVTPDEAVRIMLDLGTPKAIGIHWGTFQLSDEAIDEPAELLAAALAAHDVPPQNFPAAVPGMVFDPR